MASAATKEVKGRRQRLRIRLIKPSNIDSQAQRILGISFSDQVVPVAVRSNTRSDDAAAQPRARSSGALGSERQAVSTICHRVGLVRN